MIKRKILSSILLVFSLTIFAQGQFVLQKGKSEKISFKLINNLIVFPVEINGVELSFLLDTGVSKPIIFNFLNITEALKINQAEKIYLRGLGEGDAVEAIKSSNNIFRIGNAININQDLYAIFDPDLNFAPRLGVPIHGIIGYDFFRDFIIEVNYSKRFIRINEHKTYEQKKCGSCKILDLDFFNNKPYIDSEIQINGQKIAVKLLIDSGGSDALWLFEDDQKNIGIPDKNFEDFLGLGLSGKVYGKRAKIESISISGHKLRNVNVAFPDAEAITYARKFKDRSGSISGEILKRFNLVFDYKNNKVTIKRNRFFSQPFYYNKSGIELEHDGVRVIKEHNRDIRMNDFGSENTSVAQHSMILNSSYRYTLAPSFTVVEIRKDSPAERAGLKLGDVILNINGRHAHQYTMQQVVQMFYGETGKRIKLTIDRAGIQMRYEFKLEDIL